MALRSSGIPLPDIAGSGSRFIKQFQGLLFITSHPFLRAFRSAISAFGTLVGGTKELVVRLESDILSGTSDYSVCPTYDYAQLIWSERWSTGSLECL